MTCVMYIAQEFEVSHKSLLPLLMTSPQFWNISELPGLYSTASRDFLGAPNSTDAPTKNHEQDDSYIKSLITDLVDRQV